MAEFFSYRSNRIGGTGPNSGLTYEVVRWFPDTAGATQDITLLSADNRPKLLCGLTVNMDISLANNKSFRAIAKKKGVSPSILDPGVDLARRYIGAGITTPNSSSFQLYGGLGCITWTGATQMTLWIPLGFYMDETLDLVLQFTSLGSQSGDIHFLAGDSDRLMQAALSKTNIGAQ